MAVIASTAKATYAGGTLDAGSQVVGYADGMNRVVRFTFKTDSVGASSVSWKLDGNYAGGGAIPALRWYIGTSATSHVNAGASSPSYHGTVTATENAGEYTLSGAADIVLLPNTTYYLWLFPASTKFGYFYLTEKRQADLTTGGGAGLIYIGTGSGFGLYLAWIFDGSNWGMYILYIHNGTAWGICT